MKFLALLFVLPLLLSHNAQAASASMIIGTWVEKYADHSSQVTVFTPDTMASYALSPSGKKSSESEPMKVTYTDLGENKLRIDFDGNEGIIVEINSLNDITLDYSGEVTHDLTRKKVGK